MSEEARGTLELSEDGLESPGMGELELKWL